MSKKQNNLQTTDLIGIDIGNTGVRMAQIAGNVADLAFKRLPENMVAEGKIIAPELMAKFLKEMKEENGFSGKKCAVVLPEFSTFFRNISMPPVTVGQLKINLPYEFRDYVGDNAGLYNYDYAVEHTNLDEEGNPESLDLVAAAGLKDVISQYDQIMEKAGMKLALALPREMALINLFRLSEELGRFNDECAIIDIGYNLTRIYIFDGTHIMATRILDIGCADIDRAIAMFYNIDIYLAASYRERNYQNVCTSEVCMDVYGKFALEIMKAINFYKYENPETELMDVYFSGLGASVDELKEEIVAAINFNGHEAKEIIPVAVEEKDLAATCLMAIAVTTQKGRY